MILWRHLDDKKEKWVYHATKAKAERELERLSIVNCATVYSRKHYCARRHLERADVWQPDSASAMAMLMNKVETGEEIKWLR